MKILYNTFNDCSINFDSFFNKVDNSLTKNQRNFLSDFYVALISSNSCNFDKIATSLCLITGQFFLLPDSFLYIIKRY